MSNGQERAQARYDAMTPPDTEERDGECSECGATIPGEDMWKPCPRCDAEPPHRSAEELAEAARDAAADDKYDKMREGW